MLFTVELRDNKSNELLEQATFELEETDHMDKDLYDRVLEVVTAFDQSDQGDDYTDYSVLLFKGV